MNSSFVWLHLFGTGAMQRLRAIVGLPPFSKRYELLMVKMRIRIETRREEEEAKARNAMSIKTT